MLYDSFTCRYILCDWWTKLSTNTNLLNPPFVGSLKSNPEELVKNVLSCCGGNIFVYHADGINLRIKALVLILWCGFVCFGCEFYFNFQHITGPNDEMTKWMNSHLKLTDLHWCFYFVMTSPVVDWRGGGSVIHIRGWMVCYRRSIQNILHQSIQRLRRAKADSMFAGRRRKKILHQSYVHFVFVSSLIFIFILIDNSPTWLSQRSPSHLPDQVSQFAFQM